MGIFVWRSITSHPFPAVTVQNDENQSIWVKAIVPDQRAKIKHQLINNIMLIDI